MVRYGQTCRAMTDIICKLLTLVVFRLTIFLHAFQPKTVTIVQKSTVDKFIQTFLSALFLVQRRHRLQPILVWSSFIFIHCVCAPQYRNQRKNYHINGEQVNLSEPATTLRESCDTMKMKHVSFITRRSLFICFLSFLRAVEFLYARARRDIKIKNGNDTFLLFATSQNNTASFWCAAVVFHISNE